MNGKARRLGVYAVLVTGMALGASGGQVEANPKTTRNTTINPETAVKQEQKRYENLTQIIWNSNVHRSDNKDAPPGLIRAFKGHTERVRAVAFSPNGRYVLTGSWDDTARLWEVSTGREIHTFTGHTNWVSAVAFSPDGRYVLTGSWDETARLWDVSTGREIRAFTGHTVGVSAVAFSPDGRYVLTGSSDIIGQEGETARLWEVSTGRQIRAFAGHTDDVDVYAVAFSPDGRYVLTGSRDKTAKLWEVSTGREIRAFKGHTHGVSASAFSPDGRYVLTGSGDRIAGLWILSSKRGFDLVTEFSDEELSLAIANYAGVKPGVQDKYESKAAFRQRITDYNSNVRGVPRWWRNRAVEKAFHRVFGGARVTDVQYDPEGSAFTVDIASDSNLADNFHHRFTLTDPTPNSEAEAFEKKLRNSAQEVRFGFDNGKFSLTDATFRIDQQTYAALPSGDSFKPVQLVTAGPGEVALPDPVATDYSADPEIVKQGLELKRLRKRRAADTELKRIKGEIAKITSIPPGKAAFIFPSKPINVRFRSSKIRPDDIAVIIGNANYKKGKDIPDVTPAYADAAGIRNYIKQSLGIRDENIIFLKDASQADLIATFGSEKNPRGQLFNFVKAGNSRVFVYYSGHGAPGGEEGDSYLVPSNAHASLIDLNGYSLKTLYKNLGRLPAKSVTVVLEACFSGASQSGSLITKSSPVYLKARETGIPPNITVIAAGAANQIASWEQDSSSGLFTKYFLKGMSGEADAKPYGNGDGDGKVGYDELGRYFKETLTYYARRYYGREQTAQIVVGGLR